VRGSEEDTTVGLVGSDQGRNGRGGEDSVLANNDVLDTVTGSETKDDLSSFWRLGISSVAEKGRGNVDGLKRARVAQLTKNRPSPPTTIVLPSDPPGMAVKVAWTKFSV